MRYRSGPSRIRGSIAPLVTPLTDSGDIDHDGPRTLVRWQLAHGTHGISIGGSTGEPPVQSIAERPAAVLCRAAPRRGRRLGPGRRATADPQQPDHLAGRQAAAGAVEQQCRADISAGPPERSPLARG
ncbi:MAG: dihydrodipicolinate synthase family protein [Actinobacteria bacterium]|nr:dihydrodipicolinate synthase family protein [Actinomycetota bacterium]